MYEKIFGIKYKNTIKYPWKRRVVKIYSEGSNYKIYRILRGCSSFMYSKDILYIDKDAKFLLLNESRSNVNLIIKTSWKFPYYWNHFDHNVRCSYKLGLLSVIIGLISLVIGIISYI
jgi:hypothetical protein